MFEIYFISGCLGLSYIYFYGMDNFSLPYIVCYRWREFGDITTDGSYYGVRLHTYALFAILCVREISSFIFIELVFELFYRHIDYVYP